MDIKARLIEAAAQVYAETGYRGATTRRIAQEAGVNEITLFRHFGSKDALIQEALQCTSLDDIEKLPDEPVDPEGELYEWCHTYFNHLYEARSLIRRVMGELDEHPEIVRVAKSRPSRSMGKLRDYIGRMREHGFVTTAVHDSNAAAMLMGAIFAEAMGRDFMPESYVTPVEETIAEYVKLFLRALGATTHSHSDDGTERQ